MENLPAVLPFALIGCVVTALVLLGKSLVSKAKLREFWVDKKEGETEEYSNTRCLCGEVATEPLPKLERGRGGWDWLRSYFAMPPRYRRVIDRMAEPSLCRAHAHVADSLLESFIFNDIRAHYSTANAELAIKAAAFEQELLLKRLEGSLTDNQRRELRKEGNGTVHPIKLASNGR